MLIRHNAPTTVSSLHNPIEQQTLAPATTTPGSSQSNISNTTVTVNGTTTHVNSSDGVTSYDKTYIAGDGADVSISVHNQSSSSSSSKGAATQ